MKAVGEKVNFRVVVEPKRPRYFVSMTTERLEKELEDRCNEIIAEIKRHVDNVDGACVEFDETYVCSHCGSPWTEKSSTFNGGCCDEDIKNEPQEGAE